MDKTAMTEAERLDYLIRTLEGNNALAFSRRTGIQPPALSQIRNGGRLKLPRRIDAIVGAYPQVRREWLETGEGYPGDLTIDLVKEHYRKRLDRAERLIDTLTRDIEQKQRIIDTLMRERKE